MYYFQIAKKKSRLYKRIKLNNPGSCSNVTLERYNMVKKDHVFFVNTAFTNFLSKFLA